MPVDLAHAETQARELIAWADGYEETSEASARRVRAFCRDVLELVDELHTERSARLAMQANYQRCFEVMSTRVYALTARSQNGDDEPDDL